MPPERDDVPGFDAIRHKPTSSRAFTLLEVLAVLAVLALLIVLLVPMSRTGGREAARRAQCVNNLKQIWLALHNYEQEYKSFPPAYTVDSAGKPLHSWRTLILPFMEQESLYRSIDLSKPWNDPANARACATAVSQYGCPSAYRPSWDESRAMTTYLAVAAPGGLFEGSQGRRLEDVTDGRNWTLMVIEVGADRAIPWMAPLDADEDLTTRLSRADRPPHPGGGNACFIDGSVLFLKTTTPPRVLRALSTIAGGEKINSDEF